MISQISIPVLDQTSEEILLVAWLKREGEPVSHGEAVCEIETDKVTMELYAEGDGVLRKQLIEAGQTVPPRTVVGLVALPEDALPRLDPFYRVQRASPPRVAPPAPAPMRQPPPAPRTPGTVRASPRAKKLAAEHGIELADLHGSGPDGSIVEQDIRDAIERMGQ